MHGWPLWAEPRVRAELQLLQKGPAAARAEPWVMLVVLWESRFKKWKTATQQQLGEGRNGREAALQAQRSEQNRNHHQPSRGPQRSRPSPCSPPHRADLPIQPWRSPRCNSGCGLKEVQPMESLPTRAALGQSCSLRDQCRNSAWRADPVEQGLLDRAAACGIPFGMFSKNYIVGGIHMQQGQRVTVEEWQSIMGWPQPPFPCAPQREEVGEGG